MAKILIVDDEPELLYSFELLLGRKGHDIISARDASQGLEALSPDLDMVITDIVLGAESGLDLLQGVRARGLGAPVVMMTGQPSVDTASEAVRLGAFEYLRKPVDRDMLHQVVDRALRYKELLDHKQTLERENKSMRSRLEAIFNSVSEGLVTVGCDLAVMEANRAAGAIPGFETREGEHLRRCVPGPAFRALEEPVQKALESGAGIPEIRVEYQWGDHSPRIVAVAGSPLDDDSGSCSGLVLTIRDVTRIQRLEHRLRNSRRYPGIIGESKAMTEVYELIDDLVDTETTVLITGESGTGKELVAEALHLGGTRRSAPLVKVNCSALAESLLESELFGHVRGAFTGALTDREGRFSMAEGGTIFLDEIGDISASVQIKLLRVLQDKRYERVGDNAPVTADVRVVAATNRNLYEQVESGAFRQDLYYRLKVVEVTLPPLRQRHGDVPLLSDHFRTVFNRKMGKDIRGFSGEAMEALRNHVWPGNVRELLHAVEHACVRCRGETIAIRHLPPEIQECSRLPRVGRTRESLADVMRECGGNKSRAAEKLGISRPTLYRRLKDMGLD